MRPIQGNSYTWQGKREFVFLEKIGREFVFTCSDFAGPGDPGTVCLKPHQLKDLKAA